MDIEKQFEAKNIQNIIAYNRKVEKILNQASKDLAKRISIYELKNPTAIYQGSFYLRNKSLKKQIDIILNKLHKDIETDIRAGVISNWDLANLKNDKLVDDWANGIKLAKDQIPTSFNQLNLGALDTFIARTTAGLKISDRVWNIVSGAQDQIELYLSSGISTGKSAAGIARDLKQYLNEPNRLFRRVRQDGKLVLSKAARGYHPGAGVYRSSYKNALRLTRNEINMSYRMSDYVRRKELPFVTGIEVHLSASHPEPDMCDSLKGRYPKGFVFDAWHPQCICYTTSIMLNEKDSLRYMETGKIDQTNYINKIPKGAQDWLNKNAVKLAWYKNIPSWINNNFTKGFELKDGITQINMPESGAVKPIKTISKNKQIKRIEEFNKKYADAKIEHCIAVDKKGNILLEKSGSEHEILFTKEEMDKVIGKKTIFTHNHPSGNSFSGEDLNLLGSYGEGSEIRAVGTKYEYSAKIKDISIFPKSKSKVIFNYDTESLNLQSKYLPIYQATLDKEVAREISLHGRVAIERYREMQAYAQKTTSLLHTHEAMVEFSKKYGIEYKRWLRK